MTTVEAQIEEARKSLLDMTLRNKLLNFKQYKRSTAQVVDEIPSQIYEHLVLDENSMAFLPSESHPDYQSLDLVEENDVVDTSDDGTHTCLVCLDDSPEFASREGFVDHLESSHSSTLTSAKVGEYSPAEIENLWALPELSNQGDDRHTDRNLQTSHTGPDLQKRLYNISNRADALIEDAGYNALHLAIGFLKWTEATAHDSPNKAPLILVPVTLDRRSAQSAFNITWNQEEVTGNLSLELKLSEQGFELPDFDHPESKSGIRTYLEAVESAADGWNQWEVVPEAHLGFFDYTKFTMYQDLDPDAWTDSNTPGDHPLLRALLDSEETTTEPAPFDEDAIDGELSPMDVHHVKDADPSQIAAIEDVKRGRNLVIEGPPGTGKSQTIVNMIAELVAEDKTVLFVSEKLAALEVVKDRLDSVGVGDFCLELHSDKASKSEFLNELERIAKTEPYEANVPQDLLYQLSQRQRELNAYATALGSPVGALEVTPFALYGRRDDAGHVFEKNGYSLPRVEIVDPESITPEEHQEALSSLNELASRTNVVQPVPQHPWFGCSPGSVLPEDRRKVEAQLNTLLDAVSNLREANTKLKTGCPIRIKDTFSGLQTATDAAGVLLRSEPVDPEVLQNPVWNDVPRGTEGLIELVERTQELQSDVGQRTNPSHVNKEPAELLTEYRGLSGSILRFVRPSWYQVRNQIASLYDGEPPTENEVILQDLERIIELQEKTERLRKVDDRGRQLFSSLWQAEDSDPEQLRHLTTWVPDFRTHLLNNDYRDDVIETIARGLSDEPISEAMAEIDTEASAAEQQLQRFIEMVGLDISAVFETSLERESLSRIDDKLKQYRDTTDQLERWSRFDLSRSEVLETPAAPVVELVNSGDLSPGFVVPCYNGNLADGLLSVAFRNREVLARFDGDVHESRINSFQELDKRSIQINRERVFSKLVGRTPRLMKGASRSSPAGTLLHEFGKQRRHKPIRVLLEEAGELIQRMKPCFMMSPLSVAKYLQPDGITFDVVIFDEASQVKPEDALGTILRGQQVVMLGDTKQLPPTSFFDQVVDQRDTEDEWAFSIQDVESVLDLCRSSFPSKRLKWHYRSRHESLIAVSNQEFYDNELLIYPSPVQDTEELGLRLNHLPDTVYDRGRSSVNRDESRAVARAAVEHYRNNPSKSLGVGTFSQAQQQAILEEIELLRKENPEVDGYFSGEREEQFFVKNLERIQGDERDVIFISVGYGYDGEGRFSHNFGPLNSRGGWRRLNVLITRAREQCVVFANFTADALDASKINNRGLRSLKVFMEYAQTRNLSALTEAGDDPDSPFERGVIRYLEQEGFEVHPQVGCAGFRIDLAVPDPDNPGRYVLGIECDGASYHSSPVARARDRQRQAILEDRGWRIHRIWSTDWYREKKRTQERLIAAVENALEIATTDSAEFEFSTMNNEADGDSAIEEAPEAPSVADLQGDGAGLRIDDISEPYASAGDVPYSRLADHDTRSTLKAVVHIVEQEGPIHRDLLAKRIVEYSDVTRQGRKVSRTIDQSISQAVRQERLYKRGSFLYPPSFQGFSIRQRDGVAGNISWVPEGEIEETVTTILELQYETPKDELITQVAKVLGFSRTGARISDRVGSVLSRMIQEDSLKDNTGRISLNDTD